MGRKKRLYLLKLLIEKPNVLLLDEPTNDLDIATLTVLENFISHFNGPVMTVSHDRYFLDKVANKILAFKDHHIREFFGNYTDYLDEVAFNETNTNNEKTTSQEKPLKEKSSKKRMSYLEKKEWETIENDIMSLEDQIEKVEEEMQTFSSDYDKLSDLQKDLDQLNSELTEKYDRYEYLSQLDQ